jgi:hypothetical protein
MDFKVAVYSALPALLRKGLTKQYIALRKKREWDFARQHPAPTSENPSDDRDDLKVVYVTGFPRSGTTVLKYFFGTGEGFEQTPFDPSGFQKAWLQAQQTNGKVLVDKSNHYIYSVDNLFRACGRKAALVSAVRDPRDCIVSFLRYHENREVPRDMKFWDYWADQHEYFLGFAEHSGFGDRIIVLRYEDLVQAPESSKAFFLNAIGQQCDVTDIDASYNNQNPGEGWQDSVHEHNRIGTFALSKWQQIEEPDKRLRELLNGWKNHPAAARIMARLGYTEDGFGDVEMAPKNFHFFRPGKIHQG